MYDLIQQAPAVSPNKLAMSRALGAAFLNHQVEQLERSVSNGPSSGNWRARRAGQSNSLTQTPQNPSKRINSPGIKVLNKKQVEESEASRKDRAPNRDRNGVRSSPHEYSSRRKSSDEEKDEKDADIIVVDASVLVHALYQVKKWCRDGRDEIIIVPLEGMWPKCPCNTSFLTTISFEYPRSAQEGYKSSSPKSPGSFTHP